MGWNVSGMLNDGDLYIYVVVPMKHICLMDDFSDFWRVSLPLGFEHHINLTSGKRSQKAIEHGPVEIVNFPIKSGDVP